MSNERDEWNEIDVRRVKVSSLDFNNNPNLSDLGLDRTRLEARHFEHEKSQSEQHPLTGYKSNLEPSQHPVELLRQQRQEFADAKEVFRSDHAMVKERAQREQRAQSPGPWMAMLADMNDTSAQLDRSAKELKGRSYTTDQQALLDETAPRMSVAHTPQRAVEPAAQGVASDGGDRSGRHRPPAPKPGFLKQTLAQGERKQAPAQSRSLDDILSRP